MTITQTVTMPEIAVVFPTNFPVPRYTGQEVRLSLADVLIGNDDPMMLSDAEIIERVANALSVEEEVTTEMFGQMIVTRPASGNILIAEKPVFGYEMVKFVILPTSGFRAIEAGSGDINSNTLELLKTGKYCLMFSQEHMGNVLLLSKIGNDLPFTDPFEEEGAPI